MLVIITTNNSSNPTAVSLLNSGLIILSRLIVIAHTINTINADK